MSDKYEQVANGLQKISDNLFPLDGEIMRATTKEEAAVWYEANKKKETEAWAAYLRSQFPEPAKIEGVKGLINCIRSKQIYGEGVYTLDESEAEALITAFINAREAGKWIPVTERLPEDMKSVFVCGKNSEGHGRTAKAMYARKYQLEAGEEALEAGFFEYCEEKDESYVPEGWYEDNSCSETDYLITFDVTHWQPLPPAPKDGE